MKVKWIINKEPCLLIETGGQGLVKFFLKTFQRKTFKAWSDQGTA